MPMRGRMNWQQGNRAGQDACSNSIPGVDEVPFIQGRSDEV